MIHRVNYATQKYTTRKKKKKNPVQPPLFYIQIMETDYEMKNNSHSVNDYSRVRRQC